MLRYPDSCSLLPENFNYSSSATLLLKYARSSQSVVSRWNAKSDWYGPSTVASYLHTDQYQGFTAVHLGSIVATLWVLLLNGVVGFQILDDGTPMSLGLILGSAIAFFVGTGFIALDTAFSYTSTFKSSLSQPDNRNIALYVLYQLWPLICLVGFFLLETVLVLRVLGEKKPMRQSSLAKIRSFY